jgi:hypothetical protein
VEITYHEDEVDLFVLLEEPSPVLVINPEGVKPFDGAFEGFEVEGKMEGVSFSR